jgi:hypothetical protein
MLDDLFERSKHNRHSDHYGRDQYHNRYGDEKYVHYNPLLDLVKKLLRNKAILAGIVLTMLIIAAVGMWLIATILPYLGQVISMADAQGMKGILEAIKPLLQKIWEGSGK